MKTTDPQDELFDVVDEQDRAIGQATRGECHSKKLIHRTISVLLFNAKGETFLVRRSLTKDTHPGRWGFSCVGHVLTGQSYGEAAKRELKEELGVDVPLDEVGKIFIPDSADVQWKTVYRGESEGPFTLHPEETAGGAWMSLEEIAEKIRTNENFFSPVALPVFRAFFLPPG